MYPHLNPGVRLLLELYHVVVIKHVAFFTIWVKLTMPFTCTSLPLNLYTSVFGGGSGFRFERKFWRIDGFGRKGTYRRICISLFTPLQETISSSNTMTTPTTTTVMVLQWRKMVPFVLCRARNSVSC